MIITKEFLQSGLSTKGALNKKQIQCLGYPTWVKGWYRNSIGKEISEENAKVFLDLKNNHILKKQERINKISFSKIKESLPIKEQYEHPNWQRRRLQVMERDDFKCMLCGKKDKQLHVHHNTYEGNNIWECRLSYMITLCLGCHELAHKRKLK